MPRRCRDPLRGASSRQGWQSRMGGSNPMRAPLPHPVQRSPAADCAGCEGHHHVARSPEHTCRCRTKQWSGRTGSRGVRYVPPHLAHRDDVPDEPSPFRRRTAGPRQPARTDRSGSAFPRSSGSLAAAGSPFFQGQRCNLARFVRRGIGAAMARKYCLLTFSQVPPRPVPGGPRHPRRPRGGPRDRPLPDGLDPAALSGRGRASVLGG